MCSKTELHSSFIIRYCWKIIMHNTINYWLYGWWQIINNYWCESEEQQLPFNCSQLTLLLPSPLWLWVTLITTSVCVCWCVLSPYHGVKTELFGQDVVARQAVSLAVTLSRITETEQKQSHHGLHGPTFYCTTGQSKGMCSVQHFDTELTTSQVTYIL